jgi:alpha-1,6-mannosyltransferase
VNASSAQVLPRWRRRVAVALGSGLVALTALHATSDRWGGDFYLHVAVVRAVAGDLTGGTHPILVTHDHSAYFTPYTWALGAVSRLFGAHPTTVLAIASILIVAALVLVLADFAKEITGDPRVGAWAVLFTFVLWGSNPWLWSGHFNLRSAMFVLPYPSAFATVTGLATMSLLFRMARTPGGGARWRYGVFGALLAITIVSHLISGAWTLIGCAAIAAQRVRDRRTAVRLLVTVAAAGVAVLLWPLFPMLGLLGDSTRLDPGHAALYDDLLARCWPLLLAVPVLVWRWRRDHLDPLTLIAVPSLAIFAAGWITGRYTLGRIFPAVALVAHIAIAQLASGAERRVVTRPSIDDEPPGADRVSRRLALTGLAGVVLVTMVGVWNVAGGFRVARPEWLGGQPANNAYTQFETIAEVVPAGRVALVDGIAGQVVPAYGIRLMAPSYLEPLSSDEPVRRHDQAIVLDPRTSPSDRAAVLTRYHVDAIVLDTGQRGRRAVLVALEAGGWRVAVERPDGLVILVPR